MAIINICSNCGVRSTLLEGFVTKQSLFKKNETICVTCHNYVHGSNALRGYKFHLPALILLGSFLIFVGSEATTRIGWFFTNLALFIMLSFMTTIIHELGHALAAGLTGQKVIAINFGHGKNLLSKKIFGAYLDFKKIPAGGLTFYLPEPSSFFRTKIMITTAAGPLINLLVAWLVWQQIGHEKFMNDFFNEAAILPIIFLSNIVTSSINLLPFKFNSPVGRIWSDGGRLLTTPFIKMAEIESYQHSGFYSQAFAALQHHDYEMTQTFSEEGLDQYPDDRHLKNILGIALLEQGGFEEGRSIFRGIVMDEEISTLERGIFLNNIAYANYRINDPELLEESLALSEAALDLVPWELAIRSTRGSILIEAGQLEEGIKLLNDRRYQMLPDPTYANVKSTLAIGYAKQGKIELARETLQKAKDFDPDNKMAKRAETSIQKGNE